MNRIRLGYACVNLSLSKRGLTSRTCRLSHVTRGRLETLARENLKGLIEVLRWNVSKNIKLYRISSGIIPLASHPEAQWPWQKVLADELAEIGRYVKVKRLRVPMHPGQYTVLNSQDRSIVKAAGAELQYHADFLDHLQLDSTHKILLHVGGVYGDRNASLQRFCTEFQALPANVKSRLVLENDERSYGVDDVLLLSEVLGVPVTFDYLHHLAQTRHPPPEELLRHVYESWSSGNGRPELHYSTQKPRSRPGSHADMINPQEFMKFLKLLPRANVDIMLEAKAKDLALLSLRRQLSAHPQRLKGWIIG